MDDLTSLITRLCEATERSAKAQEDLITLATEERDSGEALYGPPACPHCGRLNPSIRNEGGEGDFAEFVLVAHCQACNNTFIGVAQGWLTYRNKQEYDEGRNLA